MAITVRDIQAYKDRGERFAMVTAYDYPTGRLVDEAGVPLILAGDTLADNVLGYDTTLPVTMEEMLHHTRAVARGVKNAMVVGDLPFLSYQVSTEEAIRNAGRLMKEAGAKAVKFEGGWADLAASLVSRGIPTMGHLGLTPQSMHTLGGYRVQGRTQEAAGRLLDDAKNLEEAGAFALVLDCIPWPVAREITLATSVPTIGIGAGPHCDGQVLVFADLLGINERPPKFVKPYAQLATTIRDAVRQFREEVASGAFPDAARRQLQQGGAGGGAADDRRGERHLVAVGDALRRVGEGLVAGPLDEGLGSASGPGCGWRSARWTPSTVAPARSTSAGRRGSGSGDARLRGHRRQPG